MARTLQVLASYVQTRPFSNGRPLDVCGSLGPMCRNIRVLHHFQPPTTPEEVRAAALQYVRKVSGLNAPATADEAAFLEAIDAVTLATERLLVALPLRGKTRTREGEREKARARWQKRAPGEAKG
jgi:hypothetical protein